MNIELVVTLLVWLWLAEGTARIILGLLHIEKNTHFDLWDTLIGIITIIVILVWLI